MIFLASTNNRWVVDIVFHLCWICILSSYHLSSCLCLFFILFIILLLVYLTINITDAGCSWKGQSAICRKKVFRNKSSIVRWSCFEWVPFTIITASIIIIIFVKRWCIYPLSGADTEDHNLNFITSNDVRSLFNHDKASVIMVNPN